MSRSWMFYLFSASLLNHMLAPAAYYEVQQEEEISKLGRKFEVQSSTCHNGIQKIICNYWDSIIDRILFTVN